MLVTGAANGIGAETANRLEQQGAVVARLDLPAGTRFSLSRQLGRTDFTTSPPAGDYVKVMRKPRR